jgi:hypothetical protein
MAYFLAKMAGGKNVRVAEQHPATLSPRNHLKLLGFIVEFTEPAVPREPMILKVKISASAHQSLSGPVTEFNNWSYRTSALKLSENYLEIDLENIPIFWNQFIGQLSSLQGELKPAFVDAMREIPEDKIGVSFKKAMIVLSDK